MVKKFLVAVCFVAAIASPATAQIPTIDAASIAKLVMQIEETKRVLEQATATTNSLQNPLAAAANIDQLRQLDTLLNQAKQLNALAGGASNLAGQLNQTYQQGVPSSQAQTLTSATLRQAAIGSAAHLDSLPSEAARINQLVSQSNSAAGVLQAQQAGNQINAELVAQIQSLRQQLILQSQAANAQSMNQQKIADDSQLIFRRFIGVKK